MVGIQHQVILKSSSRKLSQGPVRFKKKWINDKRQPKRGQRNAKECAWSRVFAFWAAIFKSHNQQRSPLLLVATVTHISGKQSTCSGSNFSGQKPCTRIISSILQSFLHFLWAIKCNKLYEMPPKKRFLWEPEKTNFKNFKLHQMKSYTWRLYLRFLNSHEIWNLFSWARIRNCLGVITDN